MHQVTTEEVLETAIRNADDLWEYLRSVLADPKTCNTNSPSVKRARRTLEEAVETVFRLKSLIGQTYYTRKAREQADEEREDATDVRNSGRDLQPKQRASRRRKHRR